MHKDPAFLPFAELAPEGRFLARGELRTRLEGGEAAGVVAYCGSGVTACTLRK